jgi:hypothetical protein
MNWNSLANFFVGNIAKQPILHMQSFYDLEKNLEQGTIDESNLAEQLMPFLNSFGNANYKLEISEINDNYHIIKTGHSTDFNEATGEYSIPNSIWAGGHPFIYAIQEGANEKTIEYYINQIKNGKRPQIILIKGNNSVVHLILDGHHKLEAYNRTDVNPICVQITKMSNYNVTDETILRSFQKLKTEENKELEIKLKTHLNEVNSDTLP